jgi:hypothetical protein
MRIEGWDTALARYVAAELAAPFEWGRHDCATFALGAVRAVAGRDLAEGLPTWGSGIDAVRTIKAAGAASALAFFAARLAEIAPAEAQRGDLVVTGDADDPLMCPAVLLGAAAMSRAPSGMVVFPRALVRRALRVG